MKIKSKLVLGFGLLLVVFLTFAGATALVVNRINNEYRYLLNFPNERVITLYSIPTDVANIRRLATTISMRSGSGELEFIPGLEQSIAAESELLISRLNILRANFNNDSRIVGAQLSEYLGMLDALQALLDQYNSDVVAPIVVASLEGDHATVQLFSLAGVPVVAAMTELYSYLITEATHSRDIVYADVMALSANRMMLGYIVVAIGVIIGIVLAVIISVSITRPIGEINTIVESVANGRFNENFRHASRDEIGELAGHVKNLISTLETLMYEMDHMADDQAAGKLDTFIDSSKFKGSFSQVSDKINVMVKDELDIQHKIVDIFSAISNGDFDAAVEQFPGELIFINQSVEAMRENVKHVSKAIESVIEAAAVRGDLEFQVSTEGFYGGWLDIMNGLNRVCATVDAPIVEIRDIMRGLMQGDFSKKVIGDYKGDFDIIKTAVNSTIDSLNGCIGEMAEILEDVSNGDLRSKITRDYKGSFSQIKYSINNITENLHKTMSEITLATDQVLTGAKQISLTAMDLANGATEQANSVEELNASIDSISKQTTENAENATQANTLSEKSTENAKEGDNNMKQMLDAMSKIKDSSSNISRIVKTIQDIAFQTNLLSLNASVEAARAGEHGRGFAVVAEEVRDLAARSQKAAKETTDLIEDSINRVDTGSSIAEATANALEVIVGNVNEVSKIIGDISVASHEQAEAAGQASTGVGQISAVVQSNSAASEETAAAAEELNSQAELLLELVSRFKL